MKPAVFVLITDGKRFLAHVRGRDGKVGLPGGKQERGETLFQAAVRETKEEYGIELDPSKMEYKGKVVDGEGRALHLFVYEVENVMDVLQKVSLNGNECKNLHVLPLTFEVLKDSLHDGLCLQLKELVFGDEKRSNLLRQKPF